jgi:hypothetical protein
MPVIAKTVHKYRGRQRKLVREFIKLLNRLVVDNTKYPDNAILTGLNITDDVNPLLVIMQAALVATRTR